MKTLQKSEKMMHLSVKKTISRDCLGNIGCILGIMVYSLNDFIMQTVLIDTIPTAFAKVCRILGLSLVIISFFLRSVRSFSGIRLFLIGLVMSFFAVNNGLLGGDSRWIDIMILVVGTIGIDYSDAFLQIGRYRIAINGLLILLVLLGFLPNEMTFSSSRIRYYLGYYWATFAAHTFLFIVLLIIWKYKNHSPIWLVALLGVINVWLYRLTDTKSPFAICMMCIVLWFILPRLHVDMGKFKSVAVVTVIIFPVLFILIYFLSKNSNQFQQLDQVLSGRLFLGHWYIDQYGLTKFGHPIYDSSNMKVVAQIYRTLDSSMMRYLIQYGVVSSFIMLCTWSATVLRIVSLKNVYYDLVLIAVALESFSDPWFLYGTYNIFLILIGTLVLSRKDFEQLLA